MYSSKAMVISIFHGTGMLTLVLHRQKEPYMLSIPSVDMRHNLMWYRPTRKIQKIRSRPFNLWKKFLGMNATELENSCRNTIEKFG